MSGTASATTTGAPSTARSRLNPLGRGFGPALYLDDISMTTCVLYEHWRLDRDECFYVGIGKAKARPYDMKKRNRHHKAIVAKAFREGFAIEVRIVASGLSWENACSLEVERIKFWRDVGADLANIASGGNGCILYGEDNPQFGKPSHFKGYVHSEKAKSVISQKMLGNKNQANRVYKKGVDHPFFGKKHSEETKRKIQESNLRRFVPGQQADQTDRADTVQTDQPTLAQEV
jgi:hypothetical protein